MNNAFTVYRVGSVSYTKCSFPNGACAAGCPTSYTECTFKKSHDKYAVWAYGSSNININKCVFVFMLFILRFFQPLLSIQYLSDKVHPFSY